MTLECYAQPESAQRACSSHATKDRVRFVSRALPRRNRWRRASPRRGAGRVQMTALPGGACALLACGVDSTRHDGATALARLNRPFVAFSRPELLIDRLETPVAAPVTAGSRLTHSALVSHDPAIVSIDPTGELVAHRNGKATVTSKDSPLPLLVTVMTGDHLTLRPAAVSLNLGEHMRLRAFLDESEVPATLARWGTGAPAIAEVDRGVLHAVGGGRTRVTVEFAGRLASADITVDTSRVPPFTVRPERPSRRVGEIIAFEALSSRGPLDGMAAWNSQDERVVEPVRGNVFRARAVGESRVCGVIGQRASCTTVRVRR
jgi:hypothetical protein